MINTPKKYIINKCVDKILKSYIDYNCHVIKLNPFNDKSKEFSIVYEGYAPWINSAKITIQDKGVDRIFLFQIRTSYNGCYADDLFLTRTDYYLYEGELTERPKVTVTFGDQTHDFTVEYSESEIRNRFGDYTKSNDTEDPVNHPNHYEMVGPFESFDIIVESLGIEGARYFCQGNVIKYQTRYKLKNGEEDLRKRHWYSKMDQTLAKCKTIEDYYKLKESDF